MPHPCPAMDPNAIPTSLLRLELHFGGDRSPLNDADADEDPDTEVYLDPDLLGLDDFADADKLDTSDIGSSSVN